MPPSRSPGHHRVRRGARIGSLGHSEPLRLGHSSNAAMKGACTAPPLASSIAQPLVIALLSVPILIQTFFNSDLAYLLNRAARSPHCVASPSALIGASSTPWGTRFRAGAAQPPNICS